MKAISAVLLVVSLSTVLAGCKKDAAPAQVLNPGPEDQIRTAIQARLAHSETLNLQAFDMEIKQVTMQGDRAEAQVDFHVKGGPGTMQLTYLLEKHDGNWAVIESNPVGSNFSHPALDPGQTLPSGTPVGTSHSLADTLKSFKDGVGAPSQGLPPGHLPVTGNPPPPVQ